MKNILLYLAIFILLFLLCLPKALRLFGADLYKKEEKTVDVVEAISCNKLNEAINISYMNGKTYNFFYDINGNYLLGDTSNDVTSEIPSDLNIVDDLRTNAKIEYDDINDITKFSISFWEMDNIPENLLSYTKDIDSEMNWLSQYGFSCTKISN